jgi:DNA modification methylase
MAVREIPRSVPLDMVLRIVSAGVRAGTHGIYSYPAKFIPHVPRWAILKFSRPGDVVLDPFCGSGTTLVEARRLGRHSLGTDFSPMAQLLTRVKTTPLRLEQIEAALDRAMVRYRERLDGPPPFVPNRDHWFSPEAADRLSRLAAAAGREPDPALRDFLRLCVAAAVRRLSFADDEQIFPERTAFGKPLEAEGDDAVEGLIRSIATPWAIALEQFALSCRADVRAEVIGQDARAIPLPEGSVDLGVTSPPYVNAMDYVRVHKLEMFWLGLITSTDDKRSLDAAQVGGDRVPAARYRQLDLVGLPLADEVIRDLHTVDPMRAYVLCKYLRDMAANFREVRRVLREGGRYVVVVGGNTMRGRFVPTYDLLRELAEAEGFLAEDRFFYVLRNRFMRIPRSPHSGLIKTDCVQAFRKETPM